MSGLAALYNRDGRPADPALLARMTNAIAHRGPDGAGHWLDGPVGLGHRMLRTTPQALGEQQPLADETAQICLTFDGRVDNRTDLRAALEAGGAGPRTETDAELVLRAYQRWGPACAGRIIGDFAFVLWDGRARRLVGARDVLGIRPFYYTLDGARLLAASELHQLFEDPTLPREPNEGMIAEYLASAVAQTEETLFRGVLRLPPAHLIIVGPDGCRTERYWDLDPAFQIRYRTDDQYAEHFLELFKEAVRCRLRSTGPVGIELSGGLDSSSVVGVAEALRREAPSAHPGSEAFSQVFPGLACDESGYIRDVVERWGLAANPVPHHETDAGCYAAQVRRYLDVPDYPNAASSYPLKRLARDKGVRVLLTGVGGDHWLSGSADHYADLLRRGRFGALRRQARFDHGGPAPSLGALRQGLRVLLPEPARRLKQRALGPDPVPDWIDRDFARRTDLAERLRAAPGGLRWASFAQRDTYRSANHGWEIHVMEIEERSTAWFGLEQRHPLHDRRILEFALAIPEEQRRRDHHTKFVLRQAMRGLLPETIRQRRDKADFSVVFANQLALQGGRGAFDSLTVAERNWVYTNRVKMMYDETATLRGRGADDEMRYIWPLWMILGIELWLNTIFPRERGSAW